MDLSKIAQNPTANILFNHFENSLSPICFLDAERTILFINPCLAGLLEYSPSEMLGRNLTDFMHPNDVEQSQARHTEVNESSESIYIIHNRRFITKSGKNKYFEIKVDRSRSADQKSVSILARFRDVSLEVESPEQFKTIESELSLLFEYSPVGIIVLNKDRRYLRANPAYQRLLGYTEKELQKLTIFDTTFKDDLGVTSEVSTSLNKDRVQVNRFKKRKCRKDGTPIWVEITSRKVAGDMLVSVVEDVTARVNLEEAQKESLQELETLFNCMSEGVVLQAKNGAIIQSNTAAEHILGLTHDEMIGRTSIDPRWRAVKPDGSDFPGNEHPAMASLATGKPLRNVIMGVHKKDASLSWISINSVPIFQSNSKEASSVLTTFADVTEKIKAEKSLLHASKMASLGEMAAGLAHEINNPLAIISGKAELMKSYLRNPAEHKVDFQVALDRVVATVERISKIVKGLRAFARSDKNDRSEVISVSKILTDTIPLMEERTRVSNVKFEVSQTPEVMIACRPVQIIQVLINLLNNSFDAIQGQPEPWIKIDFEKETDQNLKIKITDSGHGIPADIAEKMMMPFFTTKEIGKGTGLGLSISQGIMESHSGKLSLDTKSSNTCFVIELPIHQS